MIVKKLAWLIAFNFFICFTSSAQKFIPPADGNAVVYIVRTTSFGSALTFRIFHNEDFVGVFQGKGYLRYEIPAGKQLLWTSSQNRQFIDCDLKSGGTYIISSMHSPGFGKNHVKLSPVSITDSNFEKCKAVVLNNKPIITSEAKKAALEKSFKEKDFIGTTLKKYYDEHKYEKQTKKITIDMAIPSDVLK